MNFIFGAGSGGLSYMKKTKIKIDNFVDNDRNLWGKKFNSIKCIKPSDLKNKKIDKIIIASAAVTNIKSQLLLMNIPEKKILIIDDLIEHFDNFPKNDFLVSVFGDKGGLYKLNLKKNSLKKVFHGAIRGLVKINNQYICVDENKGVLILNKNFNVIKEKKLEYFSNPHCIDFDPINKFIYINITAKDSILKLSYPSLRTIEKIKIFKKKLYDSHHINSVKYFKQKLYLTMFSFKGIFRKNIWNDGALIEYDLKTRKKKIVKKNLFQPHSVQIINGKYNFCNSMKFEIKLNLKNTIKLNGYTRGLIVEDNFILVGLSKVRRLERFKNSCKYISQDAGVLFLNKLKNTSNFFKFPTTEIFEIIKL